MKRWSHSRRKKVKTREQSMTETVSALAKIWDEPTSAAVKLQVMLTAPDLYREIEEKVRKAQSGEETE